LGRAIFHAGGHDPGYGLFAVANEQLLAFAHQLEMGAELRFQLADLYRSHDYIVPEMTKWVTWVYRPAFAM